jgi:hypothetical protein
MVTYRVQLKNPRYVQSLIIAKYGTLKQFSIETRLAESTLHRILKTGKISYYAASRIGMLLDVKFNELFEIQNIREDL